MSEIKAGLWKEVGSNEYIQVYGLDKHGMVICSEEGSQRKYSLSKSDLLESYELKYLDKKNVDKSTSKTLAGLGMRTLDEYVDSLPAHDSKPVIDDTFNDDTPAQTFGGIQWDMGTQDKIETILVTVCSKCGSTVPADSVPIKVGEDLVVAIRELQKAIDSDNVIGLIKAAYKVVKFVPISEASK